MLPGRVVAIGVLCFVSATSGFAQRYAELNGRVIDPSAGAVTDANVTAADEETNFKYSTRSGPDGTYSIGGLVGGNYTVTVRKEGFVTLRQFGVKIPAGAVGHLDFHLTIGRVEDSITVVGTAPIMERPDASSGGQFDLDSVGQLPLNGRGVITLLELIPGTNVIPATRGEAGQFTTSGMRPNTNYFTVDGVSANTGVSAGGLPAQSNGGSLPALSAFGSLDSVISVEAVQDFRLQTSTTVAEFGRMPGASILLSSRAGTDQFHGAAVFRYRADWLGANDWFANQSGLPRAPLGYEDFAPTLGGPIRRNHTFFFLSFEKIWLNQPYVWKVPVPSDDLRSQVSIAERAILNRYPAPTQTLSAPGVGLWTGETNRPAGLISGSARLDQALTQRVALFARYSDSPSHNAFGMPQISHLDLRAQSLTVGVNARPNARTVLDLRLNASQSSADSVWTDSVDSETPSCTIVNLASGFYPHETFPCDTTVRFSINGIGSLTSGREGARRQRQFQAVQTAGLDLGRHSLKFGIDFRRVIATRRDPTDTIALIAESVDSLPLPQNWWKAKSLAINDSVGVDELSLWLQDTWHVNSRLTIAAGLRWEYSPAPIALANFPDPMTGAAVSLTQPLWPDSKRDFAPRLGGALRLNRSGSWVLRGGGGLYYDSSLSIATDLINGGPLSVDLFINSKNAPFSTETLTFGFDNGLKLPQVKQWNASLEHSFTPTDSVSIGYVGSTGRYLVRREVSAASLAAPSELVALTTNHGGSDYDALQLQYRRQVARGLSIAASYAWSHSLDDDSSDSFVLWTGNGASVKGDHASSDFDLRHSLTAALSYEIAPRVSRRWAGRLLGGWTVDGVVHTRTGFPITVQQSEESNGISLVNAFRPDWVYGQPLWIDAPGMPGGKVLNPAAYATTSTPTTLAHQGTLGRNVPSGFGMGQLDLSLKRDFDFGQRRGVQLRIEIFNFLNHANFGDPVKFMDSALFGQSTSMLDTMLGTGSSGSGLAPMLQIGTPRTIQLGARFHF